VAGLGGGVERAVRRGGQLVDVEVLAVTERTPLPRGAPVLRLDELAVGRGGQPALRVLEPDVEQRALGVGVVVHALPGLAAVPRAQHHRVVADRPGQALVVHEDPGEERPGGHPRLRPRRAAVGRDEDVPPLAHRDEPLAVAGDVEEERLRGEARRDRPLRGRGGTGVGRPDGAEARRQREHGGAEAAHG
jgi:hypothetical protein